MEVEVFNVRPVIEITAEPSSDNTTGMNVEVVKDRPVIEIIVEQSYAESAKKYYEFTRELYVLSGPNPFMHLALIDKGHQNGIPNTGPGLEIMDVVRGFFDANTYWKAAYYLGGDPALRSSWQPVEEAISSVAVPPLPSPVPPVPGVRNFSDDFSPTHFKIFNP